MAGALVGALYIAQNGSLAGALALEALLQLPFVALVVHVTTTLLILLLIIVPEPADTVQVWPTGCDCTVTA